MTKPITGWDPIASDAWPMIAASLAKPWPVEAVHHDLRWWAARERRGERQRPGRPALVARYGWGDRKLRDLMADPARWEDPAHPVERSGVQRGSSEGPARVQPTSSGNTVEAVVSVEKVQPTSSEGPADVQPTSTRAMYSPSTDTDTDTEHREDPPNPPPVVVDAPAKPTRPRKQKPDPLAPTDDEAADWEDALGAVAEIDAALARRIDTRASKASDGTRAAILRAMRRDTADVLIRRLRHVARTSESLAFVRSGPGVDALLVDPTKANRDGKPAWTSRLDNEAARIADTAAGSRTLAEPTPGNWRDPAWLPAVRVTTAPARGSPGPQVPPTRVPLGERMRLARLAAEAANHQPGADDAPLLLPAAR